MENANVELAVWTCIQANVPALAIGEPGVGKTSALEAMGRSDGRHVEVLIGSIREPSDFGGLPVLTEKDGVRLEPGAWAKRLAAAPKGLGIIDELTTVPQTIQAAMLRVINERVVGELKLPDTVSIVAAANPPEMAAGGYSLAPPMANRFCHLRWHVTPTEWAEGIMAGFPDKQFPSLPESWRDRIPQSSSLVAAFITHRPTLLQKTPTTEAEGSAAWPSARSWTNAARLVAAAEAMGMNETVMGLLVSGCVGEGNAMEFLNWRRELDLPDPEEILAHPEKIKNYWPKRGDRQFAVLSSISAAIIAKNTPARWTKGWVVLEKVAKDAGDICASVARTLAKNRPSGVSAPKEARIFFPLLQKAGLVAS